MGVKQALIRTNEKNFFRHWLILTRALHKLNDQGIEITALLLYYFFEFKKDISNDNLAWKLAFDYDTKIKIIEELKISMQVLRNAMTYLRKEKVIINNQISPSFIPILDDSKVFTLVFKFEING